MLQTKAICGTWADSKEISYHSITVGGRSISMLINASLAEFHSGNVDEARKLIATLGRNNLACNNLAVMDFAEGKYEDCLKKARYLLADRNYRLGAAFMSGNALMALGRPAYAVRAYKGAQLLLPTGRSYRLCDEQLKLIIPIRLEWALGAANTRGTSPLK